MSILVFEISIYLKLHSLVFKRFNLRILTLILILILRCNDHFPN